jgi:tripartite-type tricarboxylate transporter receptor subunit TctC
MQTTRRTLLQLATTFAAARAMPLHADDWPAARPIRLLIGTAAGGSPDIIGRLIGDKLSERLGQSVVVENNSQGAGAVAYQTVSKSPPDGYTLGILTAGFPPQAAMRRNTLQFDPIHGFEFITLLCGYPMAYVVAPDSPIQSFPDLLARAKMEPDKITYSITALGSIYHVLTKWIEIEAGVRMTPIPYRGTSLALSDVLSGRVDVMVDAATSAFPRIQSKQVRLLALSSPTRYLLLPNAPIIAETLPKIEFMSWLGLAAAPHTPAAIVDRLNREVHDVLNLADIKQKLIESGNIATPSTPDAMRDRIASEMARWSEVIAAAGIKVE